MTATVGERETRIGPYQLTELVGRGGMGEVYRATRVEQEFRQEVAIKVIRPERFTDQVVRRFQVERQILARLDHPHIASLLDGGITGNRQPYLVMQYVDGLPITQYVEQHHLGIQERLGLFLLVADAVQFAHANLVVHRDLKPSNILVTSAGQPRLLDFGIAKLLLPGAAESGTTTSELHLLTPEYASPEQFLGQPVTTATDVWGLGVLLYELLTGTRPFHGLSPVELPKAVLERDPVAPSRVAPRHALPPPHSDLDAIVLMALRKDPARRYASAAQMGEDVRRYLGGRPVIARPDSWGYRAGRFLGRNRVSVGVAAGVALFLAGATIVAARESRTRAIALDQAEAARSRATQLTDFMVGVFQPADGATPADSLVTARELLDRAAVRLQNGLADQPLLKADLEFAVGRAYSTLGLATTSAEVFERVLATRRAQLPPDNPDIGEAFEWLARARAYQGKLPDAERLGREALAIKERALGPSDPDLVPTLILIGRVRNILDNQDTSGVTLPLLERALTIERAQTNPDQRDLANLLRTLAIHSTNRGDGKAGLAYMREAIAAGRTVVDSNHPFLFNLYEDLATAFRVDKQLDSTLMIHRWLLAQRERVFGPEHPDVAFSLHNLGQMLSQMGKPEEAIPLLQRAIAIRERVGGPGHYLVGHSKASLGVAYRRTGDLVRSEKTLSQAVEILSKSLGPNNRHTADARMSYGRVLVDRGKRSAALDQLEAAVAAGASVSVKDAALVPLSRDPRFTALLARVAARDST